MSYDIFVQDFPPSAQNPDEIPADFKPASLGPRSALMERIQQLIPGANFSNPAWGRIEGEGWSIEVNLGSSQECAGFAFHIRGGGQALDVAAEILQSLKLRAIDPQAGGFFAARPQARESFAKWQAWRERVIDSGH